VAGQELIYLKGQGRHPKVKVVCGAEKANEIFLDFHASASGGHTGQKKTRDAISRRFYWPGMTGDINKWVSECAACQSAGHQIKDTSEHTPINVSQPFELVGMDLGKLKTTESGNQYICVMIDYYTKWSQAYPIACKNAEEVTKQILKFVFQFEAPKRILTDQGTEFVNSVKLYFINIYFKYCMQFLTYEFVMVVTGMNATIQRSLCKLVGSKPETWDEYLDAVMFGLRTKKQMTTKFSPFFLMFGRE
uniref:Gypsy retrotransposon integrase-like protein 1 n=1 Tax=Poecilia formosa TaxID=48698 RepID=A0A096M7A5_POEFO